MENEEVVEAVSRTGNGNQLNSKDDKFKAHESVTAFAGLSKRPPPPYEDTPLLSQDGRRHSDSGGEDGGDDLPPRAQDWSNADFEHLPRWRRPSIFWILPAFLISTLAYGAIIVTKLNLISDLLCDQYFTDQATKDPSFSFMPIVLGKDNEQCQLPEISALTSVFLLVCQLISGIFSAIVAPLLGAYSDRHGRLRVIAITSVGTIMGEIITITVARRSDVFSVYWIMLGYAMEGICGSFTAGMAVSNAYASDCTPPAKRARAFALFHASLFTGFAFGPLVSAEVVKYTGDILNSFYCAIAAHVCFVIFMVAVVPESLSKRRQLEAREKWKNARLMAQLETTYAGSNGLGVLWQMFRRAKNSQLSKSLEILWPTGSGSSRALRRNLVLLAAVDTTCFGVAMGSMTVLVVYSRYVFDWGAVKTQQFVSVTSICRVLVLIIILPLLTRIFRGKTNHGHRFRHTGGDNLDLGIIRLAILFDCIGYAGYAIAGAVGSGGLFVLSGCIAASGGMVSPTLQSTLTRSIPPDRTGQLLGAIALLHAIARIAAPTIFGGLYALTVASFPQTVFVCLAAAFLVAESLSWFVRPHVFFDEPAANESRPNTSGSDELRETDDLITQVG